MPQRNKFLVVILGITTCRPYTFVEKFDVHPSHDWIRCQMETLDPIGRLMSWRLLLAECDFIVHHKKGILNSQADALTRTSSIGYNTAHEYMDVSCLSFELIEDHIKAIEEESEEASSFIDEPIT